MSDRGQELRWCRSGRTLRASRDAAPAAPIFPSPARCLAAERQTGTAGSFLGPRAASLPPHWTAAPGSRHRGASQPFLPQMQPLEAAMKSDRVEGLGTILRQKGELEVGVGCVTGIWTGFCRVAEPLESIAHGAAGQVRDRPPPATRPPRPRLTYLRKSEGPGWCRTILSPKRCSAWCPGKAGARSCCPGSHCSSPPS